MKNVLIVLVVLWLISWGGYFLLRYDQRKNKDLPAVI
jgi:hypothetical protein